MSHVRIRNRLFGVVLAVLCAVPALAQAPGGQITGKVSDATGAAVQGVTVALTNQETGATKTISSAGDGSFSATGLAAGTYTVTAELLGFRKVIQKDQQLAAGGTLNIDFTLEAKLAEEITVTGTRVKGRTATETLSPVDYIDLEAIRSTGATETGKVLQLTEPSFNFSTTYISDGTDIIRPATLRSLGPDQVLVLVNGKRYHQQGLMHYQQTIARGSAGYDINSIPASAIDHIEVLRDGAAAQYGSDAIAGVINIILKKQYTTTDLSFDGGQYFDSNPALPLAASPDAQTGHGRQFMGSANTGWAIGNGGFANLTLEYRDRGETNRASADVLRVNPPRVVQRIGDPAAKDALAWLNAEIPAGKGTFYAFGGYSWRKGDSSGFFRSAGDGRTVPDLYPNGFLPTIITKPTDGHAAVGYRGDINPNWSWDLSGTWGKNDFKFREENTVNVSWYYEPKDPNNPTGAKFNESPTEADTGLLGYDMMAGNLDFTGKWNWNVGAGPLNIATGAEWRREGYRIEAGDPVSYAYGRGDNASIRILNQTGGIAAIGTQGFPGYSPREAVDESRNNAALYLDLESLLSAKFLAGAAVRFEHYSDFGSTVTGKVSARVNASKQLSLRATFSTGFRAPGVQQEFYNSRSTNLNAAGVLTDTLTARQDSAVTRAFGIPPLKEETSKNYSAGLVLKPTDTFRITVDGYRIDIKDRIIFSSNIQPDNGGPISAILAPFSVGQVQFFTNAIDTKTQGVDVVALYDLDLGHGSTLSFDAAADFNKTEVTAIRSSSSILPPAVLFDRSQVTLVEEGQPRQHIVAGAAYRRSGWKADVRANYFGKVAGEGFTPRPADCSADYCSPGAFKQTWSGKWLADVSITAPIVRDKVSLTAGALNIFNTKPDKWDCADPTNPANCKAFPFPGLGFVYGWETVPFGLNGGYYYARLNVRLNH